MATNAYAPYYPPIQGMSWVPILDEGYIPTVSEERGYWFNLTANSTVITARTYIDEPPAGGLLTNVAVNIYPEGGEKDWGPVQQVIIPPSFYTYGSGSAPSPSTSPAVVQALQYPGDEGHLLSFSDSVYYLSFATASFATQLTGKRILGVELLVNSFSQTTDPLGDLFVGLTAGIATADIMYIGTIANFVSNSVGEVGNIFSVPLGEYTPFYSNRTTYVTGATDTYPWNYASLSRLDATTTLAQRVYLKFSGEAVIGYMALRVTYCNETRVGVGGRRASRDTGAVSNAFALTDTNNSFSLPILDPLTDTTAPTLTIGDYVTTTQLGFLPDYTYNYDSPFSMGALHQLYEQDEPGIHGINISHPDNIIGSECVTTHTDLIPAISLHTSSGVVADSHGYYRQIVAPVYSGVSATQGVINSAAALGTPYSMARFYARRRGDTSSPLGLRIQATPTTSAVISVADFDVLDEIVDGWKQVDVTFTAPNIPTFNTSGITTFEFYSSTSSGARWEVLGARAPSVTGLIPTEIGPTNWLAPTTYGGTTAVATWDQGSGTPTIDFRGDMTLMFATMPQITGMAISQNIHEVDVTDECDQAPGGIPTGVYYNQLSWSTVPAITGFGGYELQRQDQWTDWQTIALYTDRTLHDFSDFEARVGVQSDYRVRACHELDFCGDWSATVSATIPMPGVTGTNVDSSVLIFTSNTHQDGSSMLAYSEIFDGTPAETFTFLEANGVTLQPMYNRDYQVAYHGTERGGETFQRVLLTNNAAVSLINFEQGFQALRDLAWDALPYVCVRDNHGSRWLASVTVPTGTIQPPGNSLQFVGVTITEVTATAYPVGDAT